MRVKCNVWSRLDPGPTPPPIPDSFAIKEICDKTKQNKYSFPRENSAKDGVHVIIFPTVNVRILIHT